MEGYIQTLSGGKTKRYVQMLDISEDPTLIAQYRKWHSEEFAWPEIRQGIREVGIQEMEIYREPFSNSSSPCTRVRAGRRRARH